MECSTVSENLKGDILRGVGKITPFLQELLDEPELSPKKVYDWIYRKKIPGGKVGADVVASKRALCAHYARATGREVA
jgi:hypothetical protein